MRQVIAELDEKKREALGKTWRKVNQDFGSIFSMLLPGTSAKLEPPEGATFLDGAPHLDSLIFYSWNAVSPDRGKVRLQRSRKTCCRKYLMLQLLLASSEAGLMWRTY